MAENKEIKRMSLEDLNGKMTDLDAAINADVKKYNEAVLDAKFDDAHALDERIKENVGEYTSYARIACFKECAAADDPMLEAIKRLRFKTIGVRDSREGDDKIPVRSVIERERPIDLFRLNTFVDGGIGSDKEWVRMVEQFNYLMTCKTAENIGAPAVSITDYAISESGKTYKFDVKSITSNAGMLRVLTIIVHAMIGGEYKPLSHDVKYLEKAYSRKARKALTISCSSHKQLCEIMAEILNRIVTDGKYDVDYRKAKNAQ